MCVQGHRNPSLSQPQLKIIQTIGSDMLFNLYTSIYMNYGQINY